MPDDILVLLKGPDAERALNDLRSCVEYDRLNVEVSVVEAEPERKPVPPGPSAPSYTVRPDSYASDMHAIQRDLKR